MIRWPGWGSVRGRETLERHVCAGVNLASCQPVEHEGKSDVQSVRIGHRDTPWLISSSRNWQGKRLAVCCPRQCNLD